jgi:bile acid:Na+ symporter, BASS family
MERLYAALLIVALVLNGVVLTGATPLRTFFAPLREVRLISRIVALDTLVVPIVIIGLATLLRLDDATRAGLVIVAAASTGPIGVALARVSRGDVALSVTLVTGLGLLNLLTIPLLTGLLLPTSIPLAAGSVLTSLAGLLIAPLLLGRVLHRVLARLQVPPERRDRWLAHVGRVATSCLVAAVLVAVTLDTELTLGVLAGPVTPIALLTMLAVLLGARLISPDAARRRTIAIVINARAVGLALTVAALHLGDVPGLRATVLAYGGLTQLVPVLVVLANRRRSASLSG